MFFTKSNMSKKYALAIQQLDIVRFQANLKDKWLVHDKIVHLINNQFPDNNITTRTLNTAVR